MLKQEITILRIKNNDTILKLAGKIGMNKDTLIRKLNNKADFKSSEIKKNNY